MADDEQSEGQRGLTSAAFNYAYEGTGLKSLFNSTADVKILCLQRFVRQFAYGQSTLILVPFFTELGFSKERIGLFMTLTLAGDILVSFLLTLYADGIGRRAILSFGAALMVVSGVVFALSSNYWILLAAAVAGVISPSGNEIGPFRAVEESAVAHLTTADVRADVYAWYGLIGQTGAALGILSCGWLVQYLHSHSGWDLVTAFRLVFCIYSALGALKIGLALTQSSAVELHKTEQHQPASQSAGAESEVQPLLSDEGRTDNIGQDGIVTQKQKTWIGKRLLSNIDGQHAGLITTLCLLFALDSFASGLVPLSWLTDYFRTYHGIEEGALGTLFFVTAIIAALSTLVAASLSKRFGNVKTMVFTHLPSSIFLALIPVSHDVRLATLFLVLRSCTSSMDVAPRRAFLAAMLLPQERTAILGVINVVKTLAQSLGLFATGLLAGSNSFWIAFVCAGSLKASYDLGLLALFKNHERLRAHAH